MNSTKPANKHWTKALWFLVLVGVAYYLLWIWSPLPDDEEMIDHFKAHRADFVEAVRRYRDYPRPTDKDTSF